MAAGGATAGGTFDHLSGGRLDLSKVRKIATTRIAKALGSLDGKKVRSAPATLKLVGLLCACVQYRSLAMHSSALDGV